MSARPCRDDRGAATVFSLAVLGVMLVLAVACCGAASLVVSHRRAEAAADLAALAGAQAVQEGVDGCGEASRIARANGADLRSCAVVGFDVRVSVAVRVASALGDGLALPARARAGPDSSADPAG